MAVVSNLILDITDGVATITLNDPGRRNAMTLEICDEVHEVLDRVDADPDIGAIVVTGAAPAFCAGADLSHLADSEEEGLLDIYEGFLRFGRSPLPVLAAVNGPAVGAGMNLALIADVRLAGESARFDCRFLQIGIHPGGGHTWMYRNIAGPQAAYATVVFGEVLDGREAERVGLVWRCIPDDQLLASAQEMAARAATAPRDLVLKTKATIQDMAAVATQDHAVQRELGPQAWSARQPQFREMLATLANKISSRH
ncbi:MAG: enoyl-CoA hydratase [Actinomycetia bacterium]|nr:enoyl-CoA hydratase [Actinomycetes bacterium]